MAVITTQVILNNNWNLVLQVVGVANGTAVAGTKIIDAAANTYAVSAYGQVTPPGTHLAFREIEYSIPEAGLVELLWDATSPVPFAALTGFGRLDYRRQGATLGNPKPAGATGSVLLSTLNPTTGASADCSFTLLLKAIKGVPQS